MENRVRPGNRCPECAAVVAGIEMAATVGEEEVLRQTFGDRFTLIAIDAEPRTIARRLRSVSWSPANAGQTGEMSGDQPWRR